MSALQVACIAFVFLPFLRLLDARFFQWVFWTCLLIGLVMIFKS